MTDRKIDYLPLDDLVEDPRNPKLHAESLIDDSIAMHGFIEPGQLDERTGRLIGGHGRLDRLRARRDRGDAPPDGVRVLRDGRWAMPVVRGWASRDDEQAARALVALNQTTIAGGFDRGLLLELLEPMPTLEGTGFLSLEDLPPIEDLYPAQGPVVAPHRPKRAPAAARVSVVRVLHGDCVELMGAMVAESVDAIVCDPPYEIGFMGKAWDSSGVAYRVETWEACLRVLKPGGHLLAFGGARTYHRMGVAIEDAGFEVRDSIHWIQGQGFPKSLDVGKAVVDRLQIERPDRLTSDPAGNRVFQPSVTVFDPGSPGSPESELWDGWATALKPSHEPIIVARKPLIGTVAENVLAYGTGALNIEAGRVGENGGMRALVSEGPSRQGAFPVPIAMEETGAGRWPPNVVLDEAAAAQMDSEAGGDVSRVFPIFRYEPKPTTAERNAGLEGFPKALPDGREEGIGFLVPGSHSTPRENVHATVKPVELMRWLVRLVTPPIGLVLDPFAGSGTTLVAAVLEGFDVVGVEQEAEYLPIIEGRVAWAHAQVKLGPSAP